MRIAVCAPSGSPAATASTIALCSPNERSLRPGSMIVRYWKRTSWYLSVAIEPGRRRVTGDLEQPAMEHRVLVRGPQKSPASSRRRIVVQDASGRPSTSSGVARSAACRAASPSSTARASRISTASCASTSRTRAPRWRSCSTESFVLEARERGAHGGAAHSEDLCQIGLDETLTRLETAGDVASRSGLPGGSRQSSTILSTAHPGIVTRRKWFGVRSVMQRYAVRPGSTTTPPSSPGASTMSFSTEHQSPSTPAGRAGSSADRGTNVAQQRRLHGEHGVGVEVGAVGVEHMRCQLLIARARGRSDGCARDATDGGRDAASIRPTGPSSGSCRGEAGRR